MFRKTVCVILTLILALGLFGGCSEKPQTPDVSPDNAALVGTWEYSDETGSIVYVFNADGTGVCKLLGYELPYTFTAEDDSLTIVTDYLTFYEGVNGMTFDEMVNAGFVTADRRYITEKYSYSINDNTLRITDIAYSNISGSDIASLTLTKTA